MPPYLKKLLMAVHIEVKIFEEDGELIIGGVGITTGGMTTGGGGTTTGGTGGGGGGATTGGATTVCTFHNDKSTTLSVSTGTPLGNFWVPPVSCHITQLVHGAGMAGVGS